MNLKEISSDYNLIMIELTNCCNLDCQYCYRSRLNLKGKMITEENLRYILSRIKSDTSIIFCGMGEQFTHPKIYEYIEMCKEHKIQLVTNGTILLDVNKLMKFSNVQSITISVDGPDEESAKKSCSGYKFDVLIENLKMLSNARNIETAVNYVVSEDNLDKLNEMITLCVKYNVKALNFLLPTNNLSWVNKNYQCIKEKFYDVLDYVESNNLELIINLPDTMFCQYNGLVTPYISVEGYVRPCCSHDKGVNVVGNIYRNTMEEIINNNKWKNFSDTFDCNECSMNKVHFNLI